MLPILAAALAVVIGPGLATAATTYGDLLQHHQRQAPSPAARRTCSALLMSARHRPRKNFAVSRGVKG